MTPKQMRIARLIRHGYTDRQIAEAMGYSPGYVQNLVSDIYRDIGVHGRNARVKLAVWYVEHGEREKVAG